MMDGHGHSAVHEPDDLIRIDTGHMCPKQPLDGRPAPFENIF
jgi:hypothetical protein